MTLLRLAFSVPPFAAMRNPRPQNLSANTSSSPGPQPQPRAYPRRAVLSFLVASAMFPIASISTLAEPFNNTHSLPKTEDEWRQCLTAAQFRVLRQHGTEPPFTSALNDENRRGTFCCAACDAPLFPSAAKFNSGTGWPSFTYPLPKQVRASQTLSDKLLLRKEISCVRCGGHLGHVFEDGPKPTGLRYCINGVALSFVAS